MTKLLKTVFTLTAAAILCSAGATQAATITYTITSDHCTGGCLTNQTNGGTITVTDTGANTVQVDVELANLNKFVNTGLDGTVDFNLAGNPTITYSGLPANWDVLNSATNTAPAGSLHFDGLGDFEYGVEWVGGVGGGGADGSSLIFTITGTGLSSASFESNGTAFFGIDIISGTTGNTGAVDAGPGTVTVPDGGSTLTLLGSVLLGVGMLRRRFSKN